MGFLDTLLGRTKPVQPDLDELFALPSAAVTLSVSTSFSPTGTGSVCFKDAEGGSFSGLRKQVEQLLAMDGDKYAESHDQYGFDWLIREAGPHQLEDLVTDLHGVNSTLAEAGFGTQLLCTVVVFEEGGDTGGGGATSGRHRKLALVYLYKRGTWYPFVPTGKEKRDNATELEIRAALGNDLKLEEDLTRWFPVYGAPGL
jgi:hypothetical protein